MKKYIIIIGVILLFTILFLNGCLTGTETTEKTDRLDNIKCESDLVKLITGSLDFQKDKENQVVSAKLSYLFKNIAGRYLNITVNAEFYDKYDSFIAEKDGKVLHLPANYSESEYMVNEILYTENDAFRVDHVKIIINEI